MCDSKPWQFNLVSGMVVLEEGAHFKQCHREFIDSIGLQCFACIYHTIGVQTGRLSLCNAAIKAAIFLVHTLPLS
jgi:hypothetical protein